MRKEVVFTCSTPLRSGDGEDNLSVVPFRFAGEILEPPAVARIGLRALGIRHIGGFTLEDDDHIVGIRVCIQTVEVLCHLTWILRALSLYESEKLLCHPWFDMEACYCSVHGNLLPEIATLFYVDFCHRLRLLLHGGQIALRNFHGPLVLSLGAELDDVSVLLKERKVPWCQVVHVSCVENLVMIGIPDPNATLQDVAPMGTLAAIIG